MPDVRQVTADYETWLGEHIPLDADDLRHKHDELSHDEYQFLRGTYYLWLVRGASEVPDMFAHLGVPLVGDLHVENFGTWRDRDQVRRWGVNDFDELARGSWLLDLVRLATSAVLAPHLSLGEHDVCDTVLGGWYAATPGPAVELSAVPHLIELLPVVPDADAYYRALDHLATADDVPGEIVDAVRSTAPASWHPTWHVREAGTGSRGHRRRAGVAHADDTGWLAREAKELGPPTCVWFAGRGGAVQGPRAEPTLYDAVMTSVRGPAAAMRADGWQIRELAPDVLRISPEHRSGHDARRLLDAMAHAVAAVHSADPGALEEARHEAVSERDFRAVVSTMADVVRADFRANR